MAVTAGSVDVTTDVASDGGSILLRAQDTIQLSATLLAPSGSIIFEDPVILTGDTTLDADRQTHVNGGSVTTTEDQTYNDPVLLTADMTLTANDITFGQTVDSATGAARSIGILARSGVITFSGDIGGLPGGALGSLVVGEAARVVFGGSDPGSPLGGPVGRIAVEGPVETGRDAPVSGGIVFNAGPDPGDVLTVTTGGGDVRLNGPTMLHSDLAIDTDPTDDDTRGGQILFTRFATIDSHSNGVTEANSLVLDAGAAGVLINANIGASGGELGSLVIDEAHGGVVFGQSDSPSGDQGPVTEVHVVGDDSPYGFHLGRSDVIGGTGIVLNGGDDRIVFSSTNDNFFFNGPVTLASDATWDLEAIEGQPPGTPFTLGVAHSVNSEGGEANGLAIDVGANDVALNAQIGDAVRLGLFAIEEAHDVTIAAPVRAATRTARAGPGDGQREPDRARGGRG